MMKSIFFVFLFAQFASISQLSFEQLNELWSEKEYGQIRNEFYKSSVNVNELNAKERYLYGSSFYYLGEKITPFLLLNPIQENKDLKRKQRKGTKKIVEEIGVLAQKGINHFGLGILATQTRNYPKSVQEFSICYQIDSCYSETPSQLLKLAIRMNQKSDVEMHFNKSIELNKYDVFTYVKTASYFLKKSNDLNKAISTIDLLSELDLVLHLKAKYELYAKAEKYPLAIRTNLEISEADRSSKDDLALGVFYHRFGEYNKSNQVLVPLFRENKTHEIAELIGMNSYNEGNYTQALIYIDWMISENDENHYLHYLKGLCIVAKIGGYPYGKPENLVAAESFKKAISLNGKIAKYHLQLGKALRNSKLKEEAVKSYNSALALDSLNHDIWYSLSRTLINQNKKYRAVGKRMVKVFEPAYKKDSLNTDYAYGLGLGYDYSSEGLFAKYAQPFERKAIYYLERSLKLDPKNLEAYKKLDLIYTFSGEREKYWDARIDLANRAIMHYPKNGHGYRELFYMYLDKNNYKKADEIYVRLCENDPDYYLIDGMRNSIYDRRKKYKWSPLPVKFYKHSSWLYTDSISGIISGKYWTSEERGCNSVSRKFTFDLENKTMRVDYGGFIHWNGEQVNFLIYDILGSYKNGLKVRIQNEYRIDWRGKKKTWDLILFNANEFKWRAYPTRQPYFFQTGFKVCE